MLRIIFLIYILFYNPCYAEDKIISNERNNYIKHFLQNYTEVKSDFIQISPTGEESRGQLFIKKSDKKILWRYKTPIMVDILMNKNFITMYDYALEQYSYTYMDNIFTQFFLNVNSNKLFEKIFFIDDKKYHVEYKMKVEISDIQGILAVTILKQSSQLKRLEFTDQNKDTTQIIFENLMPCKLDNNIFIIKGKKRQR